MTWPIVSVGDVCLATAQADPARLGRSTFRYVDISGVDREAKAIIKSDELPADDAPSRARKLIEASDILVSTVRPNLNAIAFVPPELDGEIASTGFSVLRANENVASAKFLYYWAQHTRFVDFLVAKATGASYPAVSDAIVKQAPLPLPPLREQHRIVELLEQADALRRLRREADAKSTRILPALFLDMFGDPATNPMGWPTDRLDRLFDVYGGGTPSTTIAEYWQGDIPWVSPKDMKVDVITDTEDRISEQAIANSATKLVEKGSVLIVYRSGILAHTFPVAIAGRSVTLNQDLKALRTKSDVSNELLYGLLLASQSLALSCVKKGATVHNIDGGRFLALQIPKPPKVLQERFAERMHMVMRIKGENIPTASRLERTFGLLLQKAFTGELTSKWRHTRMHELLAEMEQQAKALDLPMPKEIPA